MLLYRGISKKYKPSLVNLDKNGTDFTECPLVALLYARGTNGYVIVLNYEEEQRKIKVTREYWGEQKASRFIVWNKFDDCILKIIPAKVLRKTIRAKGINQLCDTSKSTILTKKIKEEMMKIALLESFKPLPVDKEDELFRNGIFEFNITKILAFIKAQSNLFPVTKVQLKSLYNGENTSHLDENTICNANLNTPILLAEISPGRFNVIDGNHRVAKARREGLEELSHYRIFAKDHTAFLTSESAYREYVKYWNQKIDNGSYNPEYLK